MDAIRSFHAKLRSLARTLDCETARLQRALDGEDSGEYPRSPLSPTYCVTPLNEVHKKVKKKYNLFAFLPVCQQEVVDSAPELAPCEGFQKPGVQDDLSSPCALSSSASEKPPRSPQLSDFGLERYMISQVPPNPPQAANSRKEECTVETPPVKEALVKVLKTPKCALKMDDFECVTPKLEQFGISEYTMCLNEDYTIGLKKMKNVKSEEATGTAPVTNDHSLVTPGPIIQQLEKNDAEYTNSPLAPKFCTPGLKIPSTKTSAALVSTSYTLSKSNTCSDLEVKDCTQLTLNSDECYETFVDPSSPTVSSYENLLRTPTPPEVTTIPEDILQILSKHNSNLATPLAVKANIKGAGNKENW
uniref:Spindle and kinetochore associated complex subunit 3 n=1 Tax=Jaculus jaculus TaxID=51337 RepID=A0A8C5NZQ3_JACJA